MFLAAPVNGRRRDKATFCWRAPVGIADGRRRPSTFWRRRRKGVTQSESVKSPQHRNSLSGERVEKNAAGATFRIPNFGILGSAFGQYPQPSFH